MAAGLLPALWKSSGITFRALWRVARQVLHEAAGTLFFVFAVYGALAAWRQWKTRPILWLMGFAIVYALMMAAFAFVSFRRARRVR
jgi:glycerol uptake facilitator-like aquaporin